MEKMKWDWKEREQKRQEEKNWEDEKRENMREKEI